MRVQSSAAISTMPSVTPLAGELSFVVSLLNKYHTRSVREEHMQPSPFYGPFFNFKPSIVSLTVIVAIVVQ